MESPQPAQRGGETTGACILVVDDEQPVRDLLAAVLRRGGDYRVLTAADAEEARRILQAEAVDLAVVDLVMPGMTGLELMQWARRQPGVDAEWIILSGRATFQDAVRAVQLGAFDFITKPPASNESLLVTARNALERRRMAAEREALLEDVRRRNEQLREQVERLQEACGLLTRQQEMLEADLHRAERIQRALLPTEPPDLPGFAVDVVYRASRMVGGDLYDVVPVGEHYAVLYVADAAGHGVSAAMLAVLFKHRIGMTDGRTHLPVSPATVLDRANAHIRYECSAPGLFLTAAYALLDLRCRRLTVASAGHPPLLVFRADGRVERIYHTGPALGLSTEATFAQKSVELAEGDRVLFYTDGFCDILPAAPGPGDERVVQAVRGGGGDGWELLHRLLPRADDAAAPAAPTDDLTALLLTVGATASSIDNGEPATAAAEAPPLATGAETLLGREDDETFLSVAGRGTWLHSPAFHDACLAALERPGELTVDLSLCEYLDSTFLGTLQEIADRADARGVPLRIQGIVPAVRQLLDELGMGRVLRHVAPDCRALPAVMTPLDAEVADEQARRRMLRAHQALASLSPENRQAFGRLIEHLRRQVEPDGD